MRLLALLPFLLLAVDAKDKEPSHVKLSLTKNNGEMAVIWDTEAKQDKQRVEYRKVGTSQLHIAAATTTSFDQNLFTKKHVHRAVMTGLEPGTEYTYTVGEPGEYSKEFTFRTLNAAPPYRVCIFGDLGVKNGESIPHLIDQAKAKAFDIVIHIGDIAYDLDEKGDEYFVLMEEVITSVPYMVVAGNHEEEHGGNFSSYKNLFTMPNEGYGDNQFYSFDLGPVHFVGLSSEYYQFTDDYGTAPAINQYNWLLKDLAAANKVRNEKPWIITYMHRPMYCSNKGSDDCSTEESTILRKGDENMPGLEKPFLDAKIDMGLWGHKHQYERMYPRADGYDLNNPYHNAKGPIYMVTGAAGCHSGLSNFAEEPDPYSALRLDDYGYTMLTIHNTTTLHWQQISIWNDGKVSDDVWITKDGSSHTAVIPALSGVCHPKDIKCRTPPVPAQHQELPKPQPPVVPQIIAQAKP